MKKTVGNGEGLPEFIRNARFLVAKRSAIMNTTQMLFNVKPAAPCQGASGPISNPPGTEGAGAK